MGFGDSALEFELRAWTAGSIYLGVASDLRFTIVKRLHEAGIEIPFPQRDLHLRTTDSDAVSSGRLKKQVVAPAEDGAVGSDAKDKQETKEP
jgi:small-conductance mechanosensitive channel